MDAFRPFFFVDFELGASNTQNDELISKKDNSSPFRKVLSLVNSRFPNESSFQWGRRFLCHFLTLEWTNNPFQSLAHNVDAFVSPCRFKVSSILEKWSLFLQISHAFQSFKRLQNGFLSSIIMIFWQYWGYASQRIDIDSEMFVFRCTTTNCKCLMSSFKKMASQSELDNERIQSNMIENGHIPRNFLSNHPWKWWKGPIIEKMVHEVIISVYSKREDMKEGDMMRFSVKRLSNVSYCH